MKKILCFLYISLCLASAGYAQTDTSAYVQLRKLAQQADLLSYTADSFKLTLDSIFVDVKFNTRKIHSESFFKKSQRKITIDYYNINNEEPTYMRLKENACLSHYYFSKGKLIKVERSLVGKTGKKNAPSCMDATNLTFLDFYIMKLYFDIYTKQIPAKLEIVEPE